jgi:hypothetical protein
VGEYHSSLPMLLVTAYAHKKWFTFAHDRSERSRRRCAAHVATQRE